MAMSMDRHENDLKEFNIKGDTVDGRNLGGYILVSGRVCSNFLDSNDQVLFGWIPPNYLFP